MIIVTRKILASRAKPPSSAAATPCLRNCWISSPASTSWCTQPTARPSPRACSRRTFLEGEFSSAALWDSSFMWVQVRVCKLCLLKYFTALQCVCSVGALNIFETPAYFLNKTSALSIVPTYKYDLIHSPNSHFKAAKI